MTNINVITEKEAQDLIERTIELELNPELTERVIATILNCYRDSYSVFKTYMDVKLIIEDWTKDKENK